LLSCCRQAATDQLNHFDFFEEEQDSGMLNGRKKKSEPANTPKLDPQIIILKMIINSLKIRYQPGKYFFTKF
jgi:hypothetical protein